MKSSDVDVLIVPGLWGSTPEHWQTRWLKGIRTAWLVEQEDWDNPTHDAWTGQLVKSVEQARQKVFLVAHSLGVHVVVRAAPRLPAAKVVGAFLVSPPDLDCGHMPAIDKEFGPVPETPLPFPSLLVASRNDRYCDFSRAEDFAFNWGARLVDAGHAGHINVASGHGPWPEGLMTMAQFLSRL